MENGSICSEHAVAGKTLTSGMVPFVVASGSKVIQIHSKSRREYSTMSGKHPTTVQGVLGSDWFVPVSQTQNTDETGL